MFFVSSITLISSSCKKIKDDNLDELRKNNPNFNFVKEGIDYVLKSVDLSLKEKEEIINLDKKIRLIINVMSFFIIFKKRGI